MDFDRYLQAVSGDSDGVRFDGGVTRTAISDAVGSTFEGDECLRAQLGTWGIDRFGPDAFGGADRAKWRFVSVPEVAEPVALGCLSPCMVASRELTSTVPLESPTTRERPDT